MNRLFTRRASCRAVRGDGRAIGRPRGRSAARRLGGCLGALTLLAAAVSLSACGEAQPLDTVTLQLNWFHESEFAGYYVAHDRGFFEAQGLDVTILEGGPGTPARDQLLSGEATFAITSFAEQRDLIAAGEPSVAIMAAFQISPATIFSLTRSGIQSPIDLVGRKVGVTTDYWSRMLGAVLEATGVDPASVTEIRVRPDDLTLLYDGSVDAWLGYAQDEPIKAQAAGYLVTNIYPADFGIGGYEGLLITTQDLIDTDPALVKRFLRACYDGWRYGLEHQDETAGILADWAPDNGVDFHRLAIRAVAPLVDTPQFPVGWIDAAHWQQLMGDVYTPEDPGFTMKFSPVTP